MLLEPIATLPKLRLAGLTARFPDDEAHPVMVRAVNNVVASRGKLVRQVETFRRRRFNLLYVIPQVV